MRTGIRGGRTISPFAVATALLSVLAATGAGLSIITAVHEFRLARGERTDEFFLVPLCTLAVILALSYVSWTRRRSELRVRLEFERTLRESEQKYRALVENAPVGIVVSSFDGTVIDVNDTLVRMHGYESKEEFSRSPVSRPIL